VQPAVSKLYSPDAEAEGIDLVAKTARPMAMEHVLSNGFGFGGVNASVLFRAW
jgi:3-oxoacyl-[acyl-carrier-protein] synthase II